MTIPKHLLASILLACSLAAGCASLSEQDLPEQETIITPASSPDSSERASENSTFSPAVSVSPSISPAGISSGETAFSLASVPAYSGEASVEINRNIPYFSDSDLTDVIYLDLPSKKIHRPDCTSVSKMSEKNKEEVQDTLSHLLEEGYTPCGICNPD